MTKKILLFIFIIILLLIFLFANLYFSLVTKTNKSEQTSLNSETTTKVSLPNQQTPAYRAFYSQEGSNPSSFKLSIPASPSDKGILGIKMVLKINNPEKINLTVKDIKETLLPPWQYIRKEINNNNLDIEAIYLNPQENGDTNKDLTVAQLTLPDKTILFELNEGASLVTAKDNNLEIPIINKIY